jgi:hypothetical protein
VLAVQQEGQAANAFRPQLAKIVAQFTRRFQHHLARGFGEPGFVFQGPRDGAGEKPATRAMSRIVTAFVALLIHPSKIPVNLLAAAPSADLPMRGQCA